MTRTRFRVRRHLVLGALLLAWAATSPAQTANDVVLQAMQDELQRTMAQLQVPQMEKPYFVAYRVDDLNDTQVSATLGSLTASRSNRQRLLQVELRVGSYDLDNSNYLAARTFGVYMSRMFGGLEQAPLDDDYGELRRHLWLVTDAQYKKAVEDFSSKRAVLAGRQNAKQVPDFSHELPATFEQAPGETRIDLPALERWARELSAIFRQTPEVWSSSVAVSVQNTYTRYLNSEGSRFTRWQPLVKLEVEASTRANDGEPLRDSITVYAHSLSELPARDELARRVRALGERLTARRQASFVELYNGPMLFEGRAADEVFAQVFAPALAASRFPMGDNPQFGMIFEQMMSRMSGPSFLEKIGGRVLPDFLSVRDDAGRADFNGMPLLGSYSVDDDGVPARSTLLVDKGILKTLLAGRTPVESIRQSTGSRRGFGPAPSNLFLLAAKSQSDDALRRQLLQMVKDRGLDYGIIVRRVGGGLGSFMEMATAMGAAMREGASAATTLVDVVKVFPDGHEEAVRGAELSNFTSAAFKDIVAAGDRPLVYNAEVSPRPDSVFSALLSGPPDRMPVASYVVPALLFDEVTLKKTSSPFPPMPAEPPPPRAETAGK